MTASPAPPPSQIPAVGPAKRRIAIVAPSSGSLVENRSSLIAALARDGHQITCLAPAFEPADAIQLSCHGAAPMVYQPARIAGPRLAMLQGARGLARQLTQAAPDVLLAYGTDSLVQGALAGRLARIGRRVAMVTSLAFADSPGAQPGWLTRRLLEAALSSVHGVVYHNTAQPGALADWGIRPTRASAIVVPGRGVDLASLAPAPLPDLSHGLRAALAAPPLPAKGMATLVEAASLLGSAGHRVTFAVLAPAGAAATAAALDAGAIPPGIEVQDPSVSLADLIARAHVAVLPSQSEGFAPGLLTALGLARPLVASAIPGCREMVDERVNGILVPPGDAHALADAIASIVRHPDQIAAMGRASRSKAERLFDARDVDAAITAILLGR